MDLQDATGNFLFSNVTLTTTAENVGITSPLARANRNSAVVLIAGFATVTTGTNCTHLVPRIRRGTSITSTLITEANNVSLGAAAGGNENVALIAMEQLNAEQVVQYSFTIQQVAATADGTILSAGITVLII